MELKEDFAADLFFNVNDIKKIVSENRLTEFVKFLVNYLENYLKNFEEILKNCETAKIDEKLEFFNDTVYSIVNYTNTSAIFCDEFHRQKGLTSIFLYIKSLINKINKLESNNFFFKQAKNFTLILFSLSKYRDLFKEEWKELNIYEFLCETINLIKNTGLSEEIYLVFFAIVAFTFEEKKLPKINNIGRVISEISELIGKCAQCLLEQKSSRKEYTLAGLKSIKVDAHFLENGWNIIELLECIYRFSIVDHLKYDIYNFYSLKNHLRVIIYEGNDIEEEFALKLVYQLCFDDRIAEDVYRDIKLKDTVVSLKEYGTEENLVKYCTGIILLCRQKLKINSENEDMIYSDNNHGMIGFNTSDNNESNPFEDSSAVANGDVISDFKNILKGLLENKTVEQDKKSKYINSGGNRHIMFSYNSKSKELCLKIKNELEKNGLTVWIDVENVCGSSLESRERAIEASYCVLMCMTEKYKQSSNCRLEAEYSLNLNKPIIPLLMEKSYTPDGWLGILSGSSVSIDFTKKEFDESFKRLYEEIKYIIKTNKIQLVEIEEVKIEVNLPNVQPVIKEELVKTANITQVTQISSTKQSRKKDVKYWTESDVNDWIIEKNFEKNIIKAIFPCNGEHLGQMYEMYQSIPEFFYSSLNFSKNVYLKDLAHFSNELKKLFNQ